MRKLALRSVQFVRRKTAASRSFDRIIAAASTRNEADAQFQLGIHYLSGRDAIHYPSIGVKWLTKAADQGHAMAQHNLSMIYLTGLRARGPAATWMAELQSMATGEAPSPAVANSALLYPEGLDVPADAAQAFKWAKAAAAQDFAAAQANLGMMYLRGVGAAQDFKEAHLWLHKAAVAGDAGGALGLGILHEHGLGLDADCATAARWYQLSAEKGNDAAATALGVLYADGRGVTRDARAAEQLLSGAAMRGNAFAREALDRLRASPQIP
jgi:uncharacterized protein